MSSSNLASRSSGSLFGVAFGDALGLPTEFLTFEQIKAKWPPSGPTDLADPLAQVTDDTQMTLAVGEALVQALRESSLDPSAVESALCKELVSWFHSPENNRAPGRTCMAACSRLADGATWLDATVVQSKGCGANMRVAPAAFLNPDMRAPVSQLQAALTHGHPTAVAASDLTSFAIASLAEGIHPDVLLPAMREYGESQRTMYHSEWLRTLWSRAGASSPEGYISSGWAESLDALANVERAVGALGDDADPCTVTGDGWVAEEALATALLCFLSHRDDVRRVVCRGAATRGDSDSIASIAGALAGAYSGIRSWPAAWVERIEYRETISRIAADLVALR